MTPESHFSYRQLFPWLNVFRAIALAVSFRQLIVAVAAVCALGVGQMVIDWFAAEKPEGEDPDSSEISKLLYPVVEINLRLLGSPHFTLTSERAAEAIQPWDDVIRASIDALNREDAFGDRCLAAVRYIWSLFVWAFFGLILCRLTARRVARDEDGSFRASVQFGMSRWRNGIVAPLIPTGAAALLIVIAVLAALPGRLPWIGGMIVMVVSPIVLGCSLVAAFLIVATIIGWPLMVAAIAYDDCDGFGGLSRSYSLWTGRPWQFVWYWIIAGIAGTIAMFLIGWLANCTVLVAGFALQSGMGSESAVRLQARSAGEFLIASIVSAYGISYFWTSATIIYSLLRKSVDSVPVSVIAPDDDERPQRDPLPVVGMPAMNP